jgi:preprotein translocase subunit SecD
MTKRGRLFVVLLVIVVCGIFLVPTASWYFGVPQETKDLATGSNEQIKEYARGRATQELIELKSLALTDAVPSELDHLIGLAEDSYKERGMDRPSGTWSVEDVMKAFKTEQGLFDAVENYYRSDLLAIKDDGKSILQLGLDLSGGMSILLEADRESYEEKVGQSVSEAEIQQKVQEDMEILNNRIDQFGVTEPDIRLQGTDQILVEIPGAADPERVNSFLMGKGSLTFHIVDQEASQRVEEYVAENPTERFTESGAIKQHDFLDAGKMVAGFYTEDAYGIDELQRLVVIQEEVGLDGAHITEATTGSDPITGRPTVNFQLDAQGSEIFYKLTSTNQGETLAVVMDGKVKSMAVINEPIRSSVQISGFSADEAADLAVVLRTAALPIELNVISQQAVGASLGEDAVDRGLKAIALGFLLVIIFMAVYYRRAGLIADLALLLNLFFVLSVLSAFNLTLTLTSIAGLILTVGMAVDANVIIFERIKEEYALGKSAEASVRAGFKKAFWTIMDANITTFIAALVLSQLGSGSVAGFANTLAVGIVSSMFTALFVSRLIFDFSLEQLGTKKLRIDWRM